MREAPYGWLAEEPPRTRSTRRPSQDSKSTPFLSAQHAARGPRIDDYNNEGEHMRIIDERGTVWMAGGRAASNSIDSAAQSGLEVDAIPVGTACRTRPAY